MERNDISFMISMTGTVSGHIVKISKVTDLLNTVKFKYNLDDTPFYMPRENAVEGKHHKSGAGTGGSVHDQS